MRRRTAWVLAAYLVVPLLMIAIPTAWVASGPPLCLWKHATGHDCWGCGQTRAFSSIAHGQFVAAWQYNRLVAVVFPLAAGLWLWQVIKLIRQLRAPREQCDT